MAAPARVSPPVDAAMGVSRNLHVKVEEMPRTSRRALVLQSLHDIKSPYERFASCLHMIYS
jgi:hypothetical protein